MKLALLFAVIMAVGCRANTVPPSPSKPSGHVVDCNDCKGTGKVDGQPCMLCPGTGKITDSKGVEHTCPMCRGTGKRFGECPICQGSGKLWEETP